MLRLRAFPGDYGLQARLYLVDEDYDGNRQFLLASPEKVVVKDFEEPPPLAHIKTSELSTLMDDLWTMGIRPTKKDDPNALNKHLEDMRAIVFAKLEIPKP